MKYIYFSKKGIDLGFRGYRRIMPIERTLDFLEIESRWLDCLYGYDLSKSLLEDRLLSNDYIHKKNRRRKIMISDIHRYNNSYVCARVHIYSQNFRLYVPIYMQGIDFLRLLKKIDKNLKNSETLEACLIKSLGGWGGIYYSL